MRLRYERLVWDYKNTNTQLFNRTIETFNWEKKLEDKNVNEKLYLSNKTVLNIFMMSLQIKARSLVVSDLRSETKGSRPKPMCRGDLSPVTSPLMSKFL